MSASENEVDRIIRYWVKAYFSCIHYVPVWHWPLTYFLQNWGTWPGGRDENICIFGSLYTFSFLKYEIIKCRFSCPVARQPALPLQPFCASLGGGSSSCYAPSMNFIGPSVTELLQFLIWYVTWRCDLDLWPFDLGVMSRDATWVFIPYTKFELDMAYGSGVRTITIFHWPPA